MSEDMYQSDKRKFHRLPKKTWVTILSSQYRGLRVESEDMSLGGILLKLPRPARVGEELELEIQLYELEDPLVVKGKVVAVRENNDAAVEFFDLGPATTRTIWQYLIDLKENK